MLEELEDLPTNTHLVTLDAVSMYSNIDINHAIKSISWWLQQHKSEFSHDYPIEFILKGLHLVMNSNHFDFGDLCFRQIKGMAMGNSVACMLAMLYFASPWRRATLQTSDTGV